MASRPPTRASSVFIDASVLIAAALSAAGRARDLLLAAFTGRLDLFISDFALDETERNLRRKAPAALPQFQLLASAFPAVVTAPAPLVLEVAAVVELKDAPIVAGAIQAHAAYLASYDRRHLLSHRGAIQQHFGVIVATPDEILTAFGL